MSADTSARFPVIPFSKIVSMRNRLIHAYFDVDLDIVWTTVTDDLPVLLPCAGPSACVDGFVEILTGRSPLLALGFGLNSVARRARISCFLGG